MSVLQNNINTYQTNTDYVNDMSKDFPNISYIQGSDEVKWNKYDPDHIVAVYNVTSTESATKLLQVNTKITYQIIDGVRQNTVQMNYTFDTLGEHIVKYKLDGTSIVNNAFSNCTGLTSVTIPDSVTNIGDSAFYYCKGLTNITIPDSVTNIGSSAFQGCVGLTSVTIGSGVTSIGIRAFYQCTGLTSIDIPNNVTEIGTSVFQGCTSLTSIDIPNNVTEIGQFVFQGCTSLTSIDIPNNVTNIGQYAFSGCTGLTSITVEAITPPTLGASAFGGTNNCPIYVPAESVDAYKTNWSSLASRIKPISE